jgi:hypothetical protein
MASKYLLWTSASTRGATPLPDNLWDTNPDKLFSPPNEQPDPAPSGQDDHRNEIKLKDDRGRLRLPAYVLIALGMALGVVLLVTVGVLLLAPG